MKRHPFRLIATALLVLSLGACVKAPSPTGQVAPPTGIHTAPQRAGVNLTPSRDGSLIVPPGFDGGPAGTTPIATGKTVRIGLLLPLTGRNAALGKDMQDAATVSLFDKYARLSTAQQRIRVELLPKDTGDTPEQAQAAMQQALAQGAQLIIGPVFGDATAVSAPLAQAKNVNIVSFTNNSALASAGVYAFGFSPQEQAARVVGYAMKQGKTRMAALVPNTATGDIVLEAARKTLQQANLALVGEAKYAAHGVGIEAALAKLIPSNAGPLPFDTLLLPEGGPALATILRALDTRGVNSRTVQLIGTGFWDEPNLLRRTNLSGAWLASSPPQSTIQYEQRFAATYGHAPTRISSLAYDAVALAVTLATSGRGFDAGVLTQPAGYSGPANGIFRLHPNGSVERGLAVLRVDGANLSVIDPAPAGFTGATAPR